MPNGTNTVGFTGCPDHLEVWRKQAARQAADDRFTVLWDRLVEAYGQMNACYGQSIGRYQGLLEAYSLVTGDPQDVVSRQVHQTAMRVPEAVADSLTEPVPF